MLPHLPERMLAALLGTMRTASSAHRHPPPAHRRGAPCLQWCRRTPGRKHPAARLPDRTCMQTCPQKRQARSPRSQSTLSHRTRRDLSKRKRVKAPGSPLCSGTRTRQQDRPRLHRLTGLAPCSGPSPRTAGMQATPCRRPRSGHKSEPRRNSGRGCRPCKWLLPARQLLQKPADCSEFELARLSTAWPTPLSHPGKRSLMRKGWHTALAAAMSRSCWRTTGCVGGGEQCSTNGERLQRHN